MKVWWEYIGEELAIFWESPYGHGKEKIATFWWPTHPAESTKDVEAAFEEIAARLSAPLPELTRLRAENARIRAALKPILARIEMPAGGFSRTQDVMIQASELVALQTALVGEEE